MSLYTICFSPTGGTQKVVDILAADWGEPATAVDLSAPQGGCAGLSLQSGDICLVAVPSFSGRVPAVAAERLAAVRGGGAMAVAIAVYGNRHYDDTLRELQDVLEAGGFTCIAGIAAVAEHSIMRQFATGRPDAEDARQLRAFGQEIRRAIAQKALAPGLQLPGNVPYRDYGGVPFVPKAGKSCTRCGRCAAGCPVAAIPAGDPASTDKALCISCMRCIAVCPAGARKVNRAALLVAGQKLKQACQEPKSNALFLG